MTVGTLHIMKHNTSAKADTATRLSELLLLRAAVGDGISSPFPATPCMVFSSATPGEAHANLKDAERDFLVWHDLQQKADHDEVKMLEMQIEANPSRAAVLKESLKAVKEKIARVPYPSWRDTDSHKSTLIDLLKRSAYNALSFVDEHAVKLSVDLCSPVLASRYFGWVSLTGSTSDATLIRSSATGGATIHSLAGDSLPKFCHFSSSHPSSIDKLLSDTMKAKCASAVLGKCVIIPGKAIAAPTFSRTAILSTLKGVFSKGGTDKRLPVTFSSSALKANWMGFLNAPIHNYYPGSITQSYEKAMDVMPATLATIAGAATQAALVAATIRTVQKAEADMVRPTEVTLTPEDLDQATEFAQWLFDNTSGFDRLDARGENRNKALASFASPEKVCAAEKALYDAITLAQDRKLSHEAAIRTPGVTAGLLEILVARDHRFVELKGTDNVRMGKTKRAYILKEDASIDPEEAIAEFEAACAEWDTDPESVDESEVRREFRTLQDAAERRRYSDPSGRVRHPAIPIVEMTPKQIRLVPAIVEFYKDEVCLRGTWEDPEPDFLLEADEDEPAAFTKGIPNLWFRYNSKREDQCHWTIASMLGFAEAWGKPLGQIDIED